MRLKQEDLRVKQEDEADREATHVRRLLEGGASYFFFPTAQMKSALITAAASHCC